MSAAAVPPTSTPVAVSPSPLCVGPDGVATPCAPTVTSEVVAVGTPPTLPATGGDASGLALAIITLLLVGLAVSMLPMCRRRARDSRVRRGWRP